MEARRRVLERALAAAGAEPGPAFACPYLAGREARHLTVLPTPLEPGVYHALMDLNFRRMGPVFYRPECDGCRECRALRVAVGAFRESRAQRRCRRRNADLVARAGAPRPDAAKLALYRRYLETRHDGQMSGSTEEFEAFLYGSPTQTLEVEYRAGSRLVGVGLFDVEPHALSAVYCYFEPDETRRSLGTYNVLWLLSEAGRRGLGWVYLGYYVAGSPKMSYKATFRPHQVLDPDGGWREVQGASGSYTSPRS